MQKLLILACLLLFLACKKEPKEPLLPTRDLSGEEVFNFLQLDCPAHSSANYFQGTLNGQSFCRYEGDIDLFNYAQGQSKVTQSGADPSTAVHYTDLHFRFVPRGQVEVGTFNLMLTYRDTTALVTSLGKLLNRVFKAGDYLPLSTFYVTDEQMPLPTKASVHGAAVSIEVVGWAFLDRQTSTSFATDFIQQQADRYIKCTQMKQTDNRYEIELEVNLQVQNGTPKLVDLKGVFHFDLTL
ncbi:MAG: hypothetical protein ABIQ93_04570 [Saprospiraceae bacterium]